MKPTDEQVKLAVEIDSLYWPQQHVKEVFELLAAHDAEVEARLTRATDLVRYARHYLHEKGAISDDEFAEIAQDSDGRVARLEGYDKAVVALKEPMACGHPKACLRRTLNKADSHTGVASTINNEYCTACERWERVRRETLEEAAQAADSFNHQADDRIRALAPQPASTADHTADKPPAA